MSFYLSKILWIIFNPLNMLLFFLFFGFILSFFSNKIFSKIFYSLTLVFFTIIAVIPTGAFMIYQLEKKYHVLESLPNKLDGILILSGATDPVLTKEYNQISLNGSAERLTESIQLMKKYSHTKIIFSGGSGSIHHNFTHSEAAKLFFTNFEINLDNIIYENKSRNTYENILFSKKIAEPTINEKWLVVTSAYHMSRALNVADKLGWKFIPYAVDFKLEKKFSWQPSIAFLGNMFLFQQGTHEWVGSIAYFWMGRSSKVL